ncbi:MFS transporter [Streptomyces canus]|uniref:MFS transporter n=1 Tax=Streptomyces canus TaxID=58343 RepID=UPI0036AD09F8
MASYIDGATMVSLGVAIVFFIPYFHLSSWMVGALVSGLQFAFAAGAAVGGRLGDLFGRRAVYTVDLLVYMAGVLVIILAPNSTVLFAGVIVTGLAMGADVPTSMALVFEEAEDGKRGSAVIFTQTLLLSGVIVTQLIGFAVADMDVLGGRLLFVHLFVVALVVWLLRRGVGESEVWLRVAAHPEADARRNLRAVFQKRHVVAMTSTSLFFVFAAMAPNTTGQFSAFFITTLSGASTRTATAVGLAAVIVGVLSSLLFQRYVDIPVGRRTLFVIGLATFVVGPLVPVAAGYSLWSVVAMLILTSVGGTCAGEALYKVWTQEIFSTEIRSTTQGLTYGVSRCATAGFALLTPSLVTNNPSVVMWVLSGLSVIAGVIGLVWIPRLPRHGDIGAAPVPRTVTPQATAK